MAHRRLAVLCGHLHQVDRGPPRTLLSPTHCHGDGEKGSSRSEKDCIFCKIVRGESPAFKTSAADSYNLLVNNGVAAGQVIFHTHLHIIPRRADDKLWTTESGFKRKPLKLNQGTDALAHCVRELVSLPPEDGDNCETRELKVGFHSSD